MTSPGISWILGALLAVALPGAALAEPQGGSAKGGQGAMHGGGMGAMHGKSGERGYDWYGPDWRQTLSEEQRSRLEQLHAEYTKTKLPLKARMKAAKAELAVLALADSPDQSAIERKIDELQQLQRQMLQAKYTYIADRRAVLTEQQRPSFDMSVLRKAMGIKGRVHGGHDGGQRHRGGHDGGQRHRGGGH